MAKTYRCRPSQLLALSSEFAAFCLDRAVHRFGSALDSELDSQEGKSKQEIHTKRLRVIAAYIPKAGAASQGRFADPANRSE